MIYAVKNSGAVARARSTPMRPPLPYGQSQMIVVFDIGNVLLRWDRRNLFSKAFDDEARLEHFLATACGMDFVAHTDVAADFSQAVAERAKAFPEFAEELRLFDSRWIETLGDPIEENVALMRRLRAHGRPVHALSNFAAEKFALARAPTSIPRRIRRVHRVGPRRRGQTRPADLRDPVLARRPSGMRAPVHRQLDRQCPGVRGGGDAGDPLSARRRSRERVAFKGRAALNFRFWAGRKASGARSPTAKTSL